ncbi:hypothetical protein [Jeotgalicoccus sp. S0W5]|uniref:hypothetical protein n=1 Tax=Jeotgalicoccus sp. S0W5 TaxID=2527874 RepID=UPI0014152BB0|nr:hypothetical protein [Jeotgalicoccus sp. S0W5]
MTSYRDAKKKIKSLTNFINLIDNYEINNLRTFVIKKYAIHNSMSKVVREFNKERNLYNFEEEILSTSFIKDLILSKPNDELHATIRKIYLVKTRPQRKKKMV